MVFKMVSGIDERDPVNSRTIKITSTKREIICFGYLFDSAWGQKTPVYILGGWLLGFAAFRPFFS